MGAKGKKQPRRLLPALAALTALGAAVWLGNCTVQTTHYRLASSRLPTAFSGLRIAQISDLHGAAFGAGNCRLLDAVRAAQPDLIALTGDLADDAEDFPMLTELLPALAGIAPVYYVTGNHEWVMDAASRKALFSLLEASGVTRLRNSYCVLRRGDEKLILAGVDDPNGPADQKTPAALLRQIRTEEGEEDYVLLLAHRNDQLALWASLGVDTVLSGHAHGGIVRLPLLGPVFGTHYDLFPEDAEGVYRRGHTTLFVSRGLGGSRRLPVRIGNPPELALIELVRPQT